MREVDVMRSMMLKMTTSGLVVALVCLLYAPAAMAHGPKLVRSPDAKRIALGAALAVTGGASLGYGVRQGMETNRRADADEIDQRTAYRDAGRADIMITAGAVALALGGSLVVYELTAKRLELGSSQRRVANLAVGFPPTGLTPRFEL